MLPLASGKLDPFIGIIGVLAGLQPVNWPYFKFCSSRWNLGGGQHRKLRHSRRRQAVLCELTEFSRAAENKVAKPLYAAVVRMAIRTDNQDRTLQLARDLAVRCGFSLIPAGMNFRRLQMTTIHLKSTSPTRFAASHAAQDVAQWR